MKFSIVIPVYNESKNLPLLISQIYKVLKNHTFELIIIDDNSSDGTFEVLNKIKKKISDFSLEKKDEI